MSDDGERSSIGRKAHGCDFSTARRKLYSFLLDFLPVAETDDLNLVLSCQGEFVVGIVDCDGLEGSVEDSLALDLVFYLLFVGGDMAIVALAESDHDVSVSVELVVDDLAVLGFEHQLERGRTILSDVVDQQRLLIENSADGGLLLVALLCLHGHPLQVPRLCLHREGIGGVVGVVVGNGDQLVLTARDKQSFVVPVPAHHLLGVLAHGGHFSLVLLEVEVEVALFVAAGEHGMGRRPLQPGDLELLILKRQLLQEIGGERRPQQHRHGTLRENGQHLVLVVPV